MIKRFIQDKIENLFFKGKIIIIYGPRQVGKTTLVKQLKEKYKEISLYLNCDEPDNLEIFTKTSTEIKYLFGDKKIIFIDEAQQIKNVGKVLKLLIDSYPDLQIVVTGSSSFDLSDRIVEPLTGRKYEFILYPISIFELLSVYNEIEIKRLLEQFVVYGMYPEIVISKENRDINLRMLAKSYAYKDVLKFSNIRNSDVIDKLLKALALQIGNEVSYNELAEICGVDKNTISNYIQILEKAFIIFRIGPFSRNLRNEIKKLRKIYFIDIGVRNAIINNLNPFDMRNDVGMMWENFFIVERLKYLSYMNVFPNYYFWRTKEKKEIDFIEEYSGKINCFEVKLFSSKYKIPQEFLKTYNPAEFNIVNKDNFFEILKKIL